MIDEGVTKYQCDWQHTPALPTELVAELNSWRNRLYDEGLIGYYKRHGVGFGNVSVREGDSDKFIVSGTQTGHIARTDENHYSRVTDYDIETNHVGCEGPIQASSEALTHAAIYALDPAIRAVVLPDDLSFMDMPRAEILLDVEDLQAMLTFRRIRSDEP